MTTSTPSVTRSSLTLATGTMASRVLGVVRQARIVLALGQGLVGNAFQTANNLPNVIYMLIAGGVINSVLVPQIVKAMRLPDGPCRRRSIMSSRRAVSSSTTNRSAKARTGWRTWRSS